MLIPYGTDAPIYYWPFATGALIAVNIVVLAIQFTIPEEQYVQYLLVHGDGLHPLQWLTSMFLHDGILHLLGNIVFLWAFGIVVEGKVGPFLFLLFYVGIGVVQSMIEQVVLLGADEGMSLGASAAIYGLMMIAMIWAPQDNLKILFNPAFFYVFLFNMPVAFFALCYFLWDFTIAFFTDFSISSSTLHLLGAVCGMVVGVTTVKFSWVDCEQRDLLSMFLEFAGKKPIKKKMTKAEKRAIEQHKEEQKQQRTANLEMYWKSLSAHIVAGNPDTAVATFRQIQRLDKTAAWDESMLLKLISEFQKKSKWDQVLEYSKLYLDSFHTQFTAVAINAAKVQLLEKNAPRKSLRFLQRIDASVRVSQSQSATIQKIKVKATEMIAEGALELD